MRVRYIAIGAPSLAKFIHCLNGGNWHITAMDCSHFRSVIYLHPVIHSGEVSILRFSGKLPDKDCCARELYI